MMEERFKRRVEPFIHVMYKTSEGRRYVMQMKEGIEIWEAYS
jgi:hypothetical protein